MADSSKSHGSTQSIARQVEARNIARDYMEEKKLHYMRLRTDLHSEICLQGTRIFGGG